MLPHLWTLHLNTYIGGGVAVVVVVGDAVVLFVCFSSTSIAASAFCCFSRNCRDDAYAIPPNSLTMSQKEADTERQPAT